MKIDEGAGPPGPAPEPEVPPRARDRSAETARARVLLILILGLAVALRAISALHALPPAKDALEHERIARTLAAGNGYGYGDGKPTAFRPPGYPALVAAFFKMCGGGRAPVAAAEVALGAATCLLLYLLGRRLCGTAVGLGAAAMWAVDPLAIDTYFGPGSLNSETVSAFMVTALAAVAFGALVRPTLPRSLFAGLLLGASVLTRSSLVLLPAALAALWAARAAADRSGRFLRHGAWMLAAAAAVVAPWVVRNYVAFGAFIPVSTNGGITFYRSNNAMSDGGHVYPPGTLNKYAAQGEVERSRSFFRDGREYLAGHPGRIPWLVYRKTRMLADPFYESGVLGRLVFNVWYAFLLPAAIAGAFYLWRPQPWWVALLLALILELWVVTAIFHGYPRYRFPYEPILALMAAAGIRELARRAGSRRAIAGLAAWGVAQIVFFFVLSRW